MSDRAAQVPLRRLHDGHSIPVLGLGTSSPEEAEQAVSDGLQNGYRLIDTAARYDNEVEVGSAIRSSGVSRDDLVVTSKLRGSDHGREGVRRGLAGTLERLGLDRVDLYLIHWPLPRLDKYVESWQAMIEAQSEGLITSLGVSNFKPAHLDRLAQETGVKPTVNQVQLSPAVAQTKLREYLDTHDIVTEAWSPLGQRDDLPSSEVIGSIAEAHDVSAGQVILRWHVQQDIVAIPRSANPKRQAKNLDVFSFELSADQMAALAGLDRGEEAAVDSDEHEEF